MDVRKRLLSLTESGRFFVAAHGTDLAPIAESMMFSTMDESRVLHAAGFSRRVLRMDDIEGAMHFRLGVRERELGGKMAYREQRDHALHTAYNYLLGWFVFDRCPAFRAAFRDALARRGTEDGLDDEEKLAQLFRSHWVYVSLLHDVGYLLEGARAALERTLLPEDVRLGAEHADEYFRQTLWMDIGITSTELRSQIRLGSSWEPLCLGESRSLWELADRLRHAGEAPRLFEAAKTDSKMRNNWRQLPSGATGSSDLIDLWVEHYEWANREPAGSGRLPDRFVARNMPDRIRAMGRLFEGLLTDCGVRAG